MSAGERPDPIAIQTCTHLCLVPFSSQCTATCGQGYQMRAVKCVVGTYVSVVDDNECNAATRPTDTQVSAPDLSSSHVLYHGLLQE